MYPLTKDYIPPIIDFIKSLRQAKGLEVVSNGMSTQVFGEFGRITEVVNRELEKSFEENEKVMVVIKLANADLRESPNKYFGED